MSEILHLVPGAPFGGAQRLAIDLAAQQCSTGMDASLLFLNRSPEAEAAARELGVEFRSIGTGIKRFARARSLTRNARILHLHMPSPWLGLVLPATPFKVLHLHVRPSAQTHPASARRSLNSWGEQTILSRADHAISISQWIAEAWRNEFSKAAPPTSIIFNGIRLPTAAKRPDGPFTIGIAVRLSPTKGVEEFIDLARCIHRRAPDIRFRVAGEGPARKQYEAMAAEAGLDAVMTFDGFVSDMAGFWSKVHCSAFTPPFEPFGLRLIEPIGHGVPVAAYLNGSGSDEIIERCRGIAAVPYGETDLLAERLLAIRDERAELERMATQGRTDIEEHFSLRSMSEAIAHVYQQLPA